MHEVAEDDENEDDDDDDDSSDDDDEENEGEREHLFVGVVPDSKYLCVLIPVKGTKRKQEDDEKNEQEDKPGDGDGEAKEPARPEGEEE